ncbi:MAG: enoyl-CoA hydratase/isomerase family protein [Anaerolineae bacterium]
MNYETFEIEKKEGYAVVTLDHPPANAISTRVIEELEQILDTLEADDEVRAVVFTGAGDRFFSAGADLKEGTSVKPSEQVPRGQALTRRIERYPKPFIAAINGMALGGGCELAMPAHIRIAADTAVFGQPEVKRGLMPGWGGTQRLPRLIGRPQALYYLLTGDNIPAAEAYRLGLVNQVAPAAELMATAEELAARLAKGPPIAMRRIIEAVDEGLDSTIEAGLENEGQKMIEVTETEDAMAGIIAFMMKQEPEFKGK